MSWGHLFPLGHTHYIVWSTSSDKGVLYLVGGKKIKIKIWILILVGGKNKKKVGKLLFLLKINKLHIYLCSFWKKILHFLCMSEEKIKKELNVRFFFSSGMIFPRRRTSSTKQYSESSLKYYYCLANGFPTLCTCLADYLHWAAMHKKRKKKNSPERVARPSRMICWMNRGREAGGRQDQLGLETARVG